MKIIDKIILCCALVISYCFAQCDGFNWHHEIDINDCNLNDVNVLKAFIANSSSTINLDMDINLNMEVDPLELGWQLWENGRLIHWICNDVPSPYYAYNYSCNLSGQIPENINSLDQIIKFNIQYNNLSGQIPSSICDLSVSKASSYWFKMNHNLFCPPFPECIQTWNKQQKIDGKSCFQK